MNEITAFLNDELDKALDNILTLKSSIRSAELDVEFVDKASKKLIVEKDMSREIFSSVDLEREFKSKEYDNLLNRKVEIKNDILRLNDELKVAQQRFDKIKGLIDLYDDGNNIAFSSVNFNVDAVMGYEELYNQESDRRRIAMDIHDTVLQNLSALILKNEFILKVFQNDPRRAKMEIDNSSAILKQSISDLRDIIFNLRPMSFDNTGFKDAFINLMQKLSTRTKMNIIYEFKGDDFQEDSVVMINIIRIIQELCTNSIKYSNGSLINVIVNSMKTKLKIFIHDDGKGFDYNNMISSKEKGFGLTMVSERIHFFKGNLKAYNDETGMKYEISIPLKRG